MKRSMEDINEARRIVVIYNCTSLAGVFSALVIFMRYGYGATYIGRDPAAIPKDDNEIFNILQNHSYRRNVKVFLCHAMTDNSSTEFVGIVRNLSHEVKWFMDKKQSDSIFPFFSSEPRSHSYTFMPRGGVTAIARPITCTPSTAMIVGSLQATREHIFNIPNCDGIVFDYNLQLAFKCIDAIEWNKAWMDNDCLHFEAGMKEVGLDYRFQTNLRLFDKLLSLNMHEVVNIGRLVLEVEAKKKNLDMLEVAGIRKLLPETEEKKKRNEEIQIE
jgi:hypothetical protein